jgi:NAD(P)-dependent dehydrogenase (short-subunit alcohol dehydrogenase family)
VLITSKIDAPETVRTESRWWSLLHQAFRSDLAQPTREDAKATFSMMQAMPAPYIEPQDVSDAVVFLASDSSRYLTGTHCVSTQADTRSRCLGRGESPATPRRL